MHVSPYIASTTRAPPDKYRTSAAAIITEMFGNHAYWNDLEDHRALKSSGVVYCSRAVFILMITTLNVGHPHLLSTRDRILLESEEFTDGGGGPEGDQELLLTSSLTCHI